MYIILTLIIYAIRDNFTETTVHYLVNTVNCTVVSNVVYYALMVCVV